MNKLQVTFLGSGDAFGSGGRMQTCIMVKSRSDCFLIDCGATAMIALRKYAVNPNEIRAIFLTHLHGDHFAGIPFLLLDAQLVSKRTNPLLIAGPPGTKKRIEEAMEIMFPGSSSAPKKYALNFAEFDLTTTNVFGPTSVTPYIVNHPSGAPSLALRIEHEGKVIAYSGDTDWTETLVPAARQADLFISECYFFAKKVKYHLDFQTLRSRLHDMQAKRLVLTHMGGEMLQRLDEVDCEWAEDGKTIEI